MDVSRRPASAAGSVEPTDDGKHAGFRPYRNGLPVTPNYTYRSRVYPWAQRAIEMAEAEHGAPKPVCAQCGAKLNYAGGFGKCPEGCGGKRKRMRVR